MELLAAVKLANTGMLLWQHVGPLIQAAMERGDTEISMDKVEAAAILAGTELALLRAVIAQRTAQG